MGDLVIREMTHVEAKECVSKINSTLTNVRSLILELYERKGWEVLGYRSWRECVTKEFKQSERYLYRQLEAAQTEKNIWPIGQKSIPESQLRLLTSLPTPELQKEAWEESVRTAPEGRSRLCTFPGWSRKSKTKISRSMKRKG